MSAPRVVSRPGRRFTRADCPTCGAEEPSGDDLNAERQRRWAIKHAADNPGHTAHLTAEATRIYQAEAP